MVLFKHQIVKEWTQEIYDSLIQLIVISAIRCPCGHVGFHLHGTYERKVKLALSVLALVVQRIRCPECGKTHALLPYDLIPWSRVPLKTIIRIVKAKNAEEIRALLDEELELKEEDVKNARYKFRKFWRERILSYGIAYDSTLTDQCLSIFNLQFMQNRRGQIIKYVLPTFGNIVPSNSSL